MPKYLLTLLALALLVVKSSHSQTLYESFSDADFTSNPIWSGDVGSFTIVSNSDVSSGTSGSNTLRLSYGTNASGVQSISTQISTWDDIQTWGFYIGRRSQAYTAANKLYIWLYANESDLESSTVDGYRIAIGDDGGDDDILLEYVVNGSATTILTGSTPIPNGLTKIGILIRVTRTQTGLFTLYTSSIPTSNQNGAIATDIPNATNTSVNQGSITHSSITPSTNGYFGISCVHATSSSARTAVEFDQFYFDTQTASLTTFDISNTNTAVTIDFDNAVTGINGAAFNGSGIDTAFSSGKINSSAFRISGLSDGNTSFGGTYTTGDFARGTSSGGVTTGGVYAFDTDNSAGTNYCLGFQASGTDMTSGEIVLKTFNETGSTINNILVSYTIKTYNDQGFSTYIYPSYSTDDVNYTSLSNYNYTTTETASGAPSWTSTTYSILIDNLTLTTGNPFYFKWETDDYSGSGSRDELGLDDISITLNPSITAYYYSGSGALENTSNWGTTTDGSGTNPSNFTDPLQYFYLQNTSSVSTTANLTISGSGSKLIVGDGSTATTLTVNSSFSLAATIDVSANSNLILQHTSLPSLGSLASSSTVTFNPGTSFDLPTATYGNIVIDNSSVNNPATSTDLVFAGNFTLQNSASFSCTNYNLHTTGTANQTISANGNSLSVGFFENNNTYSKTGTLTLASNSPISINDRIIMNNTGASNAFIDGGNTITVADDIHLGGDTAGYQLTGTFILTASSGSAVIADNTSNSAAVPYFNHIILNTSGTATITVRPFSGTGTLKIGGDLTISSTSSGAITLNNNSIYLYGNFTSSQTSDLITEGGSTLLFMKSGTQSFDISASTNNSFNKLKIGSTTNLALSGNLSLADSLVLNGKLTTNNSTLQLDGYADFGANHTFSFDGASSLSLNGANLNAGLTIDQTTSGTTNKLSNFTLNSTSGSVTLNNVLQVSGAVTLSNGTLSSGDSLILTSDASSTGYIAEITGTGVLSGKITQQRYISGTADYRELAAAVSTTFADWDSTIITSGFTGSDYPSYNFNNIYAWDETATTAIDTNVYVGVSNITDSLKPGVGYSVYVYPDTGNFPLTLTTSGTPATGNFTFSVTQNGTGSYAGYNLVGNPYPCAIDWDAASWTKTNVGSTIYIWDYANQQYDAWQTGVGGTNGGSNIIPSSRAFWVKASGASPSLIATEACKTTSQGTFYRSNNTLGIVTASCENAQKSDELKIIWNENATPGLDAGLDANKMWNYGASSINIYSKTASTPPLVFNHIGNTLHTPEVVEIWARVHQAGTYNIHLSTERLSPERIVLTPISDATATLFCLAQNSILTFTATSSNAEIHVANLEIYPEIKISPLHPTCQNTADGSITVGIGARDSVQLQSSNGQSITGVFSNGELNFNNLPSGTYTLLQYYTGICMYQQSQQITMAAVTTIQAGMLGLDSIEINAQYNCQAVDSTCNSYLWSWGDGTQFTGTSLASHSYSVVGPKTIAVNVSKNGCDETFSKTVIVTEPLSTPNFLATENLSKLNFWMYQLQVSAAESDLYSIEIFTLEGKMVYSKSYLSGNQKIDLSHFISGVYIVSMTAENGKSEQLKISILQ